MVGRYYEAISLGDQQGFWSKGASTPIHSNSRRPGCNYVEPSLSQQLFSGLKRANSPQATDLMTWYYQDVQPHYAGMMAAGEYSPSARMGSSDFVSLRPGPFVGAFPHVGHS